MPHMLPISSLAAARQDSRCYEPSCKLTYNTVGLRILQGALVLASMQRCCRGRKASAQVLSSCLSRCHPCSPLAHADVNDHLCLGRKIWLLTSLDVNFTQYSTGTSITSIVPVHKQVNWAAKCRHIVCFRCRCWSYPKQSSTCVSHLRILSR